MILITRPLPEAVETEQALHALGFETQIEPMLHIHHLDSPPLKEQPDAVLFTSGNGVRNAPDILLKWQSQVFAVGLVTAELSTQKGFSKVISANGNVEDLFALVKKSLQPGTNVLHICGRYRQDQLREQLQAAGYVVTENIVYDAIAAQSLSSSTIEKIRTSRITSALFFSPRTAKIFMQNYEVSGLKGCTQNLSAYCMSSAVANELKLANWKKIYIADQPTHTAMLDLIQSLKKV